MVPRAGTVISIDHQPLAAGRVTQEGSVVGVPVESAEDERALVRASEGASKVNVQCHPAAAAPHAASAAAGGPHPPAAGPPEGLALPPQARPHPEDFAAALAEARRDLDAHWRRQEATISVLSQHFEQYQLSALSMEENLKALQHKVAEREEQLGQLVLTLRAEVKGVQHELQTHKAKQEDLLNAVVRPQPVTAAPDEGHTKLILTLQGEVAGLQHQLSDTQSQLASVAAASQPQEDWTKMKELQHKWAHVSGELERAAACEEQLDQLILTLRAEVEGVQHELQTHKAKQEDLLNAVAQPQPVTAAPDEGQTKLILTLQGEVAGLQQQLSATQSQLAGVAAASQPQEVWTKMKESGVELKEMYALLEKRQAGQEQQLQSFQAEVGNLQQQLPLQVHSLEQEIRGLRLLSEGEQGRAAGMEDHLVGTLQGEAVNLQQELMQLRLTGELRYKQQEEQATALRLQVESLQQ